MGREICWSAPLVAAKQRLKSTDHNTSCICGVQTESIGSWSTSDALQSHITALAPGLGLHAMQQPAIICQQPILSGILLRCEKLRVLCRRSLR